MAANMGSAVAYLLTAPPFFSQQLPLMFWGLGAMLAATKVAARVVQREPQDRRAPIFRRDAMALLRVAPWACLTLGWIIALEGLLWLLP